MDGIFLLRLWPRNGTLVPYEHCILFFFRAYQEKDQPATGSGAARFSGLDAQSSCSYVHTAVLGRTSKYVQRIPPL